MLTTIDASRPELPLPTDTRPSRPRWFAAGGYVIRQGSRCEVHVGGLLVGVFDVEDHARRNLLLVTLAESPSMHLSQLAAAFEVSVETSRALRRQAEREGIAGVGRTLRAGAKSKLTAKQLAKARSLLDEGASADGLRRRFPGKISIRTAQRIRSEWLKAGRARSQPSGPGDGTSIEASGSPSSGDSAGTSVEAITDAVRDALAKSEIEKADVGDVASATAGVTIVISDMADRPATKEIDPDVAPQDDERNASVICGEPTDEAPDPSTTPPAAREILDDARGNAATSVRSARGVQYLGTWLMMAMLSTWKLHDRIGVLGNGTAKATGCDRARWLMSSRTNSSMPITGLRGIRRRGRCPSAAATGSAQGAMPTARRA